jgi:hypothetical protein
MDDASTRQLAHDIFKQLIEINTTDSVGSVTAASEAMAQRFRDAGFPDSDIQVLGPNDRKKNVVVRLHGSGKHKPVLLIGHLDVVGSSRVTGPQIHSSSSSKKAISRPRHQRHKRWRRHHDRSTLIRMKREGYIAEPRHHSSR